MGTKMQLSMNNVLPKLAAGCVWEDRNTMPEKNANISNEVTFRAEIKNKK
jgi:hypothetical protein